MDKVLLNSSVASLLMPLLLLFSIILDLASAVPFAERRQAVRVPSDLHTVRLTRNTVPKSRAVLSDRFRKFRGVAAGPTAAVPAGVATALPAYHDVEYLIDVKLGNTTFSLIIDTGSSDTWLVKEGFQCLNAALQTVSFVNCNFGPVFKGNFSGGQIPGQHFNISYGSGNGPFLNGQMGYSDLTLAGVTIPKQQIALATVGSWNGDGISSGILGLGLPGLTEAFKGNQPAEDGLQNLVNYSPVVTTVSSQVGNGIFSLGLSRNASTSFLALGGVPTFVKVGNYASTPIEKMSKQFGGSDYFFYTMTAEQLLWKNRTQSGQQQPLKVIVDSGTTLNLLPYNITRAVNAQYSPPAIYIPQQGGWFVPCNAVPPSFGVQIAGQVFWAETSSMILQQVRDPNTNYCATGFGTVEGEPWILGDVFFQGLVAVFDTGPSMEMRFAKRL
ncbi:aspartic peptidase domain-containing protein [Podospora didyma]|uniref:Aspartic peptidase domain-containing protein n=1 Tax=Podospora didyma TaxID=330526 RepID=A0AAE0NBQ4_9PEZI|nr:aspartic peptidase domain-containing protein [Podospora didyma]